MGIISFNAAASGRGPGKSLDVNMTKARTSRAFVGREG
jgi:hypothetical protein